jgi:hypothetical protein
MLQQLAQSPAADPWYADSVYLLTGFLVLGLVVVGVILLVLWRTRMKD